MIYNMSYILIHTHIYGFPGGSGNYILIHISVTVLKKECVCSKIYLLEKKKYIYNLVAQIVENLHAKWETWTEEPGGLQFMGSQKVRHD